MNRMRVADDEEFVFIRDDGQLMLGTARTCDNCGCLCAINESLIQRPGFLVNIYRHEVRGIGANDNGDALCEKCYY